MWTDKMMEGYKFKFLNLMVALAFFFIAAKVTLDNNVNQIAGSYISSP